MQEGFEYRLDAELQRPDGLPLLPEEARPHFVGVRFCGARFAARVPFVKSSDGGLLVAVLRVPLSQDGGGEVSAAGAFAGSAELQAFALEGRYFATGFKTERFTRRHDFPTLTTRVARDCRGADKLGSSQRASLRERGASRRCSVAAGDYSLTAWDGFWARVDACAPPFCGGLGRISAAAQGEADAAFPLFWVYRQWRCTFDVFSVDEAQRCLEGRKILFSMDSNGPHTLVNLVGVVLNATPSPVVRKGIVREFASRAAFLGPRSGNISVAISYNGHPDVEHYHEGLSTVLTPAFAARHAAAVAAFGGGPAFLTVVNSGLHDLALKFDPAFFAAALPRALDVYDRLDGTERSALAPLRVWRTSVAPAGDARTRFGNPQTIEILNAVSTPLVLERAAPPWHVVDEYDMTFPFCFDNRFSDGGHYGGPGSANFIDIMLIHVYARVRRRLSATSATPARRRCCHPRAG